MSARKIWQGFGWLALALASTAVPAQTAAPSGPEELARAISELEPVAASGDSKAKGLLSSYLVSSPPPFRDLARGCRLAQEAAQADDSRGLATQAQCLMGGTTPSSTPFPSARASARKAMQLGDPAGAFLLYVAFNGDPQNSYLRNGVLSDTAYSDLAARPLAERGEQIEALEGLAFAVSKGHIVAAKLLALYYVETTAPGNTTRLKGLAAWLAQNGEASPDVARYTQQADSIQRLGNTKASVKVFLDAYRRVIDFAALSYTRSHSGETCSTMQLKSVSAGEIVDAVFLPLKSKLVDNTFLMAGQWSETWDFSGCGMDVPVNITFKADGWGGSKFVASAGKPGNAAAR